MRRRASGFVALGAVILAACGGSVTGTTSGGAGSGSSGSTAGQPTTGASTTGTATGASTSATSGAGGAATTGSTSGAGGSGGGLGTGGAPFHACPPPHSPAKHRLAEAACHATVPDPSLPACTADADCLMVSGGTPGKCVDSGGGKACQFDQCLSDSDCASGDVCSCQGQTIGYAGRSYGNICIPADCHVDTDCGTAGFCSPTVSPQCGSFYGTQGFYCHGCKDTCIDDTDCPMGNYCAYDPAVGYWACSSGFCAG